MGSRILVANLVDVIFFGCLSFVGSDSSSFYGFWILLVPSVDCLLLGFEFTKPLNVGRSYLSNQFGFKSGSWKKKMFDIRIGYIGWNIMCITLCYSTWGIIFICQSICNIWCNYGWLCGCGIRSTIHLICLVPCAKWIWSSLTWFVCFGFGSH